MWNRAVTLTCYSIVNITWTAILIWLSKGLIR